MDYEQLGTGYWDKQITRLSRMLEEINKSPIAAVPGRVIPSDQDLALGTGRTLKAAVMFTDICAFSARSSSNQAEQNVLLNVLNFYFSEMIRIAEEYGGTVEKNTGDGLMAYFEDNAGDPPESAVKRATAASLTMMYVNDMAISPVLQNAGIEPIKFRIGIDYGVITIAQLGAPRRFGGLVAIGTTANIASKMLYEAGPGDILIGEEVYKNLPQPWQTHCSLHTYITGFVYVLSGLAYSYYKYSGRWKGPM